MLGDVLGVLFQDAQIPGARDSLILQAVCSSAA